MKTKLLALLMFVSFGILCGQTINMDQTGDGHEVIIHQIGDNTINIEHSGTAQSVDIYQEGELNTADVVQTIIIGYETYPGNNEAVIMQAGEENVAGIYQISGYNNNGQIVQFGNGNHAAITQGKED